MKTIQKYILLKSISITLLMLSTLGCKNPSKPEEKIIFEKIENPAFDKIVKDKIYYSELSDNIQSKLEFNTDLNSLTITQYHWDSEYAPTWDYIYGNKYDYLFNKKLSKIGAKLTSYYKTDSEGLEAERAYALSGYWWLKALSIFFERVSILILNNTPHVSGLDASSCNKISIKEIVSFGKTSGLSKYVINCSQDAKRPSSNVRLNSSLRHHFFKARSYTLSKGVLNFCT